jgi:NADPH:quinone reductase-like Zn-dependent oxidoreductase
MREVAMPVAGPGEILVQVRAASVTTADWRFRASAFPGAFWLAGRLMAGLVRPRNNVLGRDFAGRVVAVGDGVTRLTPGDAVFGATDWGAHAEYLAIAADGPVCALPANLGFDEAAAVPFGALSALVFLRDFARLEPGGRVLVLGAAGGVGVWAVQIARKMGAEVIAVGSTANVAMLRDLGAGRVIDRTHEDFRRDKTRYDVILDTVGASDFAECRPLLAPDGRFVPLEFGLREVCQSLFARNPRVVIGVSGEKRADLEQVAQWLQTGDIRPVIDGHYRLDQIAAAHARVESRRKSGAVILTVGAGVTPYNTRSRSPIRSSASSSPTDIRKIPSPA